MGLLSKIKSALGLGGQAPKDAPAPRRDAPAEGQRPGDGQPGRKRRRRGGRNRNGQPRPEGQQSQDAARGPEPRSRSAKPRTEGDRPARAEGANAPVENRPPREGRPEGRRDRGRGDRRDRRDNRRDRGPRDRGDRGDRNTPAGQMRPGGAFTEAQLKEYAAAHAAWDPASYDVPPAEGKKRFVDFGLPGEILHAVADLGFQYCTPIQAQSLEFSLAGKNVAGKAQTGTGKTAAFLIAVLTRYLRTPEKRNLKPGCPRALILAPTRELVIQICKDAEALGKYCGDVRSLAIYGGMDHERQRRELEEAPVDLLVATPGRLKDYLRSRVVDLRQVDTLVIDEADRMLDMGFIPDVRAIVNRLPDRDHRCTMLYSATLNDTVMNLAAMWMRDPVRVEIESDKPATDTVKQIVYIARSEEKFTLLYNHLARNPEARTLIFCNRKFTTERLAENLRRRGIDCEVLSGDVNQSKRLRILEAFRAGKIRIVVATDVAGRGIHVDDIAYVVNYDFPYEPEDYVHRIGRTGRAGHTGTAISFADEDESFIIPDIEQYINEPLKCSMPEEWMFTEPPAPAPRGRRRDRKVEADKPEAPAAEGAPEDAPVQDAPVGEAPVPEASVTEAATPAEGGAPAVTDTPTVEAKSVEAPTAETDASADASAEAKPEADKPERPREQRQDRGPRRPRDNNRRGGNRGNRPGWARTQADGPRDGSESHHAARPAARPIYAPGRQGPVADEWSPGE